ncbi:MAG TPA: TerC family protein [Chloroflexaceae bacterium]|nr:TerC family protein [Chloroflexaceae bacterium]
MDAIFTTENLLALLTLTVMEIVLGIDNIIFISILASRLPKEQQARARQLGLGAALVMRILLLLSISWIASLTNPLFAVFGFELSGRDLILLLGGLFLIYKATHEIHAKLEGEEGHGDTKVTATFTSVIVQIMLLDIVFSLDSVITAVGMADALWVMITAVVISIGIMLFAAGPISEFVNRHPTVKMLALSFLLLIGFSLVVEGLHFHIPKGYIYFAMGFSILVEMLNLRMSSKSKRPVELKQPYLNQDAAEAAGQIGKSAAGGH